MKYIILLLFLFLSLNVSANFLGIQERYERHYNSIKNECEEIIKSKIWNRKLSIFEKNFLVYTWFDETNIGKLEEYLQYKYNIEKKERENYNFLEKCIEFFAIILLTIYLFHKKYYYFSFFLILSILILIIIIFVFFWKKWKIKKNTKSS